MSEHTTTTTTTTHFIPSAWIVDFNDGGKVQYITHEYYLLRAEGMVANGYSLTPLYPPVVIAQVIAMKGEVSVGCNGLSVVTENK